MAGRKLIKKQVAGFTIIEVLISMTVIIIIFGIAMTIYADVTRSSLSVKKLKAEALLRERLLSIEQNPIGSDETSMVGNFLVEQHINSYNDHNHLKRVQLIAWDVHHAKIAEIQIVFIAP